MFLKNKNIIFKIRRSKVTDYAALKFYMFAQVNFHVNMNYNYPRPPPDGDYRYLYEAVNGQT